jgi:hypothetical protein
VRYISRLEMDGVVRFFVIRFRLDDVFAFAHCAWAKEESEAAMVVDGVGGGRRNSALFNGLVVGVTNGDDSDSSSLACNGGSSRTAAAAAAMQAAAAESSPSVSSWFNSEVSRQRFDLQVAWRVSKINADHKLCPTYPEEILVPHSVSDAELEKVASFRTSRRIPSVVFRHVGTGAVLARCSQPEVGLLGWRSAEDEKLVRVRIAGRIRQSLPRATCLIKTHLCHAKTKTK